MSFQADFSLKNIYLPHKNIIMENFTKLKGLIASMEVDADKFYNKASGAAGTRVRKALQEIKTLAQEMRNEVTELKNKEA